MQWLFNQLFTIIMHSHIICNDCKSLLIFISKQVFFRFVCIYLSFHICRGRFQVFLFSCSALFVWYVMTFVNVAISIYNKELKLRFECCLNLTESSNFMNASAMANKSMGKAFGRGSTHQLFMSLNRCIEWEWIWKFYIKSLWSIAKCVHF